MRFIAALIAASILSIGSQGAAQSATVVELYTSQGCSSCPPADKFLHELAKQDDIIALALHVDYWDYIGWKDEFADPAHAVRQKAYARIAGARTVYTPQMVIGGVDHVIGTRPEQVAASLTEHMMKPAAVAIEAARSGQTAQVTISAQEAVPAAVIVQLVTYRPESVVAISRGENAGRTLSYANVVTSWTAVEAWDGQAPLNLSLDLPNDDRAVVIVQAQGPGPILAAMKLN